MLLSASFHPASRSVHQEHQVQVQRPAMPTGIHAGSSKRLCITMVLERASELSAAKAVIRHMYNGRANISVSDGDGVESESESEMLLQVCSYTDAARFIHERMVHSSDFCRIRHKYTCMCCIIKYVDSRI